MALVPRFSTGRAMADPMNKDLATMSEELATYTEDSVFAKKDGHYLNALVNVGMMNRNTTLLTEWDKEGPQTIGLLKAKHNATTLEAEKSLVTPLVANAARGSRLRNIVRDLQLMKLVELLVKNNGLCLQALLEAGDEDKIQ